MRYFLLKQYFCAMLCIYAFQQLVGEYVLDYIRLEIFYFLTLNMNEMQYQQNHFG